jgi:hypothetical protein
MARNSRFGATPQANSATDCALGGWPTDGGICYRELARAVNRRRSDVQCFRSYSRTRKQTLTRNPGTPTAGLLFRFCVRQGPARALVNRAALRLGPATSISRARAHSAHRGRNEKPDLCTAATCTKNRPYLTWPRYRTAAKDVLARGAVRRRSRRSTEDHFFL